MSLTIDREARAFVSDLLGAAGAPPRPAARPTDPARRARTARLLLMALVPLLFLLAGCAGKLRETGFLQDYTEFNRYQEEDFGLRVSEGEDRTVDQYFLTEKQVKELEKRGEPVPTLESLGVGEADVQPVLFVVSPVTWTAAWEPESEEEKEAVLFTVRERMYRYLLRQYPHPVRVRYAYVPDDPIVSGYRVLIVETAVTDVNPGVGWLRYVIGYGAGTTALQLEGRVHDEEKTVAEFAIREAHAGYPNGFMNLRVFNTAYCLRYAAEEAVGDVSEYLRAAVPAARLRPGVTLPEMRSAGAGME